MATTVIPPVSAAQSVGKDTYRVIFADLVAVAGVAVQILGSATRIVRVTRIHFAQPSVAQNNLIIRKNSTAAGAATGSEPTPVPLDSVDVAAGAVVRLFTAAPAAGVVVGSLYEADHGTGDVIFETFGDEQNTQGVVLRGVAEAVTIVLSAGATINGYIEFTEE